MTFLPSGIFSLIYEREKSNIRIAFPTKRHTKWIRGWGLYFMCKQALFLQSYTFCINIDNTVTVRYCWRCLLYIENCDTVSNLACKTCLDVLCCHQLQYSWLIIWQMWGFSNGLTYNKYAAQERDGLSLMSAECGSSFPVAQQSKMEPGRLIF